MDQLIQLNALSELLNEYDVARLLKVSVATVRRRRQRREPPFPVKIGANVRYEQDEVKRFLAASRATQS